MHKSSLHDALHAGRRNSLLTLGVLAVLTALASSGATASAQSADKKTDLETRPEFREPIVLTSTDGVLEVRLTPQGKARQRSTRSRHLSRIFSFSTTRSSVARHPTGRSPAAISIQRPLSRYFPAKG